MSSCCDSLQLGNIEPNMVAKTLAKWKQHNGNQTQISSQRVQERLNKSEKWT